MSVRTRYLQLSLTTMLEYNIEDDGEQYNGNSYEFEFTQLMDKHYLILNPASFEAGKNDVTHKYEKLPLNGKQSQKSFVSSNTIIHTAVPTDKKDSEWFLFVDNDYEYTTDDNINELKSGDFKVESYSNYCTNPVVIDPNTNKHIPGFYHGNIDPSTNDEDYDYQTETIKWDNIKLYFSTGYDFSDIYGALFRLCTETQDGNYLDLCDYFFTKSSVYKYITYMAKPIVFGNVIYDKYLSIKVLSPSCVNTIINSIDTDNETRSKFLIKPEAPVKILFSYVEDENFALEDLEFTEGNSVFNKIVLPNSACYFTRANSIKGTIPREKINSDNLGLYIASVPNYPYIEFYGTWKGVPLSTEIVHKFNLDIPLYNQSMIKRSSVTYEINKDYKVEYNLKKWIVMHEIQADILEEQDGNNVVLKSETYTQSQVFIGEKNETLKFYYRPVIFDDEISLKIAREECTMAIKYTLRLMNIEDSVQFIKTGSITLYGSDLTKFCHKTTSLNFSDRLPYKVYNKIVEKKQVITSPAQSVAGMTKYVKHFYDSTTIKLDIDSTPIDNNQYTLLLSQAPKNYKFVFKQQDINNNLKYIDLTDSYYKLFVHDAYGGEIVIEPTYSNNMNLLLGELEFNIGANTLRKLKEVPVNDRQMTIIAYNVDNTTSAMYDFKYSF